MSNRLLSLLTEIQLALMATDPAPEGGSWDILRLINFHQGLARLTLAVRSPARVTAARGSILLQSFILADGSECLKANLTWQGTEDSSVYSIYAKPQIDWRGEAGRIAARWLEGQPSSCGAQAGAESEAEAQPVGSLMEATG